MTSAAPRQKEPRARGAAPLIDDEACRVFQSAAEFAGKKWSAAILLALARGATRFSQIEEAVDGISARLLSARLRELEAHDLVVRHVVATVPVQITYHLAPSGDELIRILHPLVQWAQRQDRTDTPLHSNR